MSPDFFLFVCLLIFNFLHIYSSYHLFFFLQLTLYHLSLLLSFPNKSLSSINTAYMCMGNISVATHTITQRKWFSFSNHSLPVAFQLTVGSWTPCRYILEFYQLTLCRPCAGSCSSYELMHALAIPCPEDSIHSTATSSSFFPSSSAVFPEPWWERTCW